MPIDLLNYALQLFQLPPPFLFDQEHIFPPYTQPMFILLTMLQPLQNPNHWMMSVIYFF